MTATLAIFYTHTFLGINVLRRPIAATWTSNVCTRKKSIRPKASFAIKDYPEFIRHFKFINGETGKRLVIALVALYCAGGTLFLTNNMNVDAVRMKPQSLYPRFSY